MKESLIVVYVPAVGEYGSWYLEQFLGLYYSVVHKTDLYKEFDFLVTGPVDVLSQVPAEHCHFVPLEDLSQEPEFRLKYSDAPYTYVNSFAPFVDGRCIEIMSRYKYTLRLDVDTFLAPLIRHLKPRKKFLCVGHAAYASETARQKLPEIMEGLELPDREIYNLGSTWFGETSIVQYLGAKTVDYVKYFISDVFHEEKGAWPQWFAGVTLLYASHVAINAAPESLVETIHKHNGLDCPSSSEKVVDDGTDPVYSIHCWHGDKYFSKFQYSKTQYRDVGNILDSNKVPDYSLDCARGGTRILEGHGA